MPCHWGFKDINVVSQTSATGSQCLPAVGCAEAGRYIVRRPQLEGCTAQGDEVVYVSLGEGATSEGEFWESLNTACTLHLPVLYVVADNGFAISVPSSDQAPAPISELLQGFRGLKVWKFDGCDYLETRTMAAQAVARVRVGTGPSLIHARVTRPFSHSAADTQAKYRSRAELADEAMHDPIDLLEHLLIERGALTADSAKEIRAEARQHVASAAREALNAARPTIESVTHHVYEVPSVKETEPGGSEEMAFGDALNRCLHELMELDERIRVFGEDVADAREELLSDVEGKGGVFGTTRGLQRKFGLARCFNTPLAEANIVGRAVGQAVRGLRPMPEIQFFDYIWPAMEQIKTEAATTRWRSNGAWSLPMVIRVPIGGYLTGGAIWHSQCGESIFAHVPGLIVMFPSNAADAVGLLRTAHACEDPVMFLEHKHLLRQAYTRAAYPDPDYMIPLGRGRVARSGDAVTVVTWGATVEKSRQAIADTGIDAELIDLRCLIPWDQSLVASSVDKTGRVLVVHEDILTCGFGAEVAAWVGEHCFASLDAPVSRIGALDTHVAYEPSLERAILPQTETIAASLRTLCAW